MYTTDIRETIAQKVKNSELEGRGAILFKLSGQIYMVKLFSYRIKSKNWRALSPF